MDMFGAYEQMNLFAMLLPVLEKTYDRYNPCKDKEIPEEAFAFALQRGSGFINGKERIRNCINSERTFDEKVAYIRHEYGTGCSSFSENDYQVHYFDVSPKGYIVTRVLSNGFHQCKFSWNKVTKKLEELVKAGVY